MPLGLKSKLTLIAGCCAASAAVGLILGAGSSWLSQVPKRSATAPAVPPATHRAAATTPGAGDLSQPDSNGPRFATTRDGRMIHIITGKACPVGTRPAGRRDCVRYCLEGDMFFWEESGRCIPKGEAKLACEAKAGTWMAGEVGESDRCRVPLTEIDPRTRQRLDRLGR